jgi:5-methylcytosine-specific restriction endonuclease McrA
VKVARQIPEITTQLNEGTLSLTSVAMAQSLFANAYRQNAPVAIDTKKEILKSLENCTKRESEDKLIEAATKLGLQTTGLEITEKVRPISFQESVLQVRLKTSTLEKLNRLKNLRAHKNPNMGYADLIEDLCTFALKKLDPLEQTLAEQKELLKETQTGSRIESQKGSQSRKEPQQNLKQINVTDGPKIITNPRYIPPHIRREVWRRDQGRCTYVAEAKALSPDNVQHTNFTGQAATAQPQRCRSNHLLQIDHIKPVSLGGETVQQNLRLLCHAHHKMREGGF